jgi:hypothetical protein
VVPACVREAGEQHRRSREALGAAGRGGGAGSKKHGERLEQSPACVCSRCPCGRVAGTGVRTFASVRSFG